MITVPYTIKELYHQDHCYKNIRIHFPNGERTDICNNLIVKDSVSFTESLCSQNTLKFGLCESPIFECEVVGVGNIKGATIEVSVEIECPFSASGAEWKADLQKYIYSIPYGTFIVDSCKRQADMQHRKIVAYGGVASMEWAPCEFEKNKVTFNSETYTPNMGYFIGGCGVNIVEHICDKTSLGSVTDSYKAYEYAGAYTFTITCQMTGVGASWVSDSQHFYKFTQVFNDDPQRDEDLDSFLDYIRNGFSEISAEDKAEIIETAKSVASRMNNIFYSRYDRADETYAPKKYTYYMWSLKSTPTLLFYPYHDGNGISEKIVVPRTAKLTIAWEKRGTSFSGSRDITFSDITSSSTGHELTYKTDYAILENLTMTFPMKFSQAYTPEGLNWTKYRCPDFSELDMQNFASALAELLGVLFTWGRDGNGKSVYIRRQFGLTPDDDLYPDEYVYPESVTGGELQPRDYESCWYDDEYKSFFGAIFCKYKNTNNEDVEYTLFFPGYNEDTPDDTYETYDLSNNEIIKAATWTSAQIETICGWIASAVTDVSYMPVEFVGRGLPYVESGDTFEILTRSNDSITTIVLNRTLTGEMTLTDTYKSV